MTKFLGFEHSEGEMTDRDTGELIVWDNYLLHFMTDSPDAFGSVTMTQKIKAEQFAKIVGVTPEKLAEEIEIRSGSEVLLSFVPKRDKLILTGIRWVEFQ